MAWMKIDLELPDKPEVHAIASMLNIDPDCVVGKLIRVWQWFDKHTTDGNAYGVTFALPDRIAGVAGFGEAMAFVGWLEQHDKTLVMPKFDRHTSESAKARALAAKRASEFREKSNAKSNAVAVTGTLEGALPREEKNININIPKKQKPKKTTIPDGFGISDAIRKWASANGHSQLERHLEHFVSYCVSNGKEYVDFDHAFQNAIRQNWAKIERASAHISDWTQDPIFAGGI